MAESIEASKDAEEIQADSSMKHIKDLGPPSLMTRKFMQAEQANYSFPQPRVRVFRKKYHFFYGTLMDPQILAKVLKLDHLPRLVPTRIIGYHCKLWGDYPALVDGEQGEPVHGMAYEVQSPEENDLLQAYETDLYYRTGCNVEFEDGTEVFGRTFKWHGDKMELKEGEFNHKDWKMDTLERELESSKHHP